ncbi:uncharacterized protein TrAtP1_004430 [Trichoderma atroviride]|uniref:uncharacterized protein n=1 Tax=Hypocrea atroviridis TaxID=63577 RepID=UPI00332B751C|nr:hypothetical protein TrAtP1_004430 [Trichoderma atroviride]
MAAMESRAPLALSSLNPAEDGQQGTPLAADCSIGRAVSATAAVKGCSTHAVLLHQDDVGGNEAKTAPANNPRYQWPATRFALRNVTSMQEKIHTRDHGEELASGQILMLQTGVERRSTRKLCHRKLEPEKGTRYAQKLTTAAEFTATASTGVKERA